VLRRWLLPIIKKQIHSTTFIFICSQIQKAK